MTLNVTTVETDVLIIGGGLAGCMGAIKASEYGGRITIAEKSNTVCSGSAGFGIDHIWGYCPPVHGKLGWSIEDMAEDHRLGISYGLFTEDLFYLIASTMYDRVLDLEKFGLKFRYDDSKIPGRFRIVPQFHSVPSSWNFDGREIKQKLTKEAKKRGVNIINRVMVTDLLTDDGEISGALAVGTRTADIYLFKAKAVVLCTGRTNRLSRHPSGIDFEWRSAPTLTGDGKAMALHAGLDLINLEFFGGRSLTPRTYHNAGGPWGGAGTWYPASNVIDYTGKVVAPRQYFYDWEKAFQEGIDPLKARRKWIEKRHQRIPSLREEEQGVSPTVMEGYIRKGPLYGGISEDATPEEIEYIRWSNRHEGKCYRFSTYHLDKEMNFNWAKDRLEMIPVTARAYSTISGAGVVVGKNLETRVKGLFAAGDEVGGMPMSSAAGAVAEGWYAGQMAAKRAREQAAYLRVDEERVKFLKRTCAEMLESKEGFFWKEVELALQNIMDLNCADLRSGPMLERGLELLQDLRNAPIRAENPHELSRSLEVKSLIDVGEMVMRSSLERKESRKRPVMFLRADYPEQDDENWLAFLALRQEDGGFKFSKLPPSQKW